MIKEVLKFTAKQVVIAAATRVGRTAGDELGKAVVKEGSKKIAEQVVKTGEDGKIEIPTSVGGAVDLIKKSIKNKNAQKAENAQTNTQAEAPQVEEKVQEEVKPAPAQIPTDNEGTVTDTLVDKAEEFGSVAKKSVDQAAEVATATIGNWRAKAQKVTDGLKKGYGNKQ